ncbi:hypothetical protein A3C23_03055 [Candidatus Roizmanbacteria bacterium RIFCSPHIGHO2_02_FULL_37_13b]|uniref:Uncharacterized protein n=1 Tax=Candidatus Roizmanbacteria bacterium RIFCSPLOWO2_02_FULL_36_11 TaxID=1802071 RepID=A0A1F7JI99_9BACT|nr:MAG: hypothetical protein A3C23_03055 [Candidatus Roizmanbacteria bacterium RIFCSPHIGHO2_02_FULL_37_13b]OGK55329.1 MAG: hypothetical protein A3H78_04490 [Candidatus Roizmanbacteria bacterium RIFCSPLOWO2_02_FULL_36_11]
MIQILNIIGYADDKQKFAQEFLTMCMAQTSAKVLANLPIEKQKEIQEKIKKAKDQNKITSVLREYQNIDEYQRTLIDITKENFTEYIEKIMPTLTSEQKDKLLEFLSNQR